LSKKELRREVIQGRMALSEQEVSNKSNDITRAIINMKEYQQATTIMAYVDFRHEVQTGEFIRKALNDGKRLAVPLTDMEGKRLVPSLLKEFPEDLTPGAYGILEPRPECLRPITPGELELVIVPGVAFDVQGNRLGFGGGFYDRFLPQTGKDCLWLAPAFELQIQDNVYPDQHDCPVHILVTEDRIIKKHE